MDESGISEDEAREIVRQFNESKQNVHTFFTNVIKSKDTTKTGNLTIEELGMPKLPLRSLKELALFCSDISSDNAWNDYFTKLGEIQTSTSLSKDALLLKLSVTQKRELADVSPKEKKKNRGWFRKKEESPDNMNQT
jgi:hypothetical protein